MDYFKDVPGLAEQVKPKKIKVMFRVWPEGLKVKHYKDLNQMAKDFSKDELQDAVIDVIVNSVVVGNLDAKEILSHVF